MENASVDLCMYIVCTSCTSNCLIWQYQYGTVTQCGEGGRQCVVAPCPPPRPGVKLGITVLSREPGTCTVMQYEKIC